MKKTFHTILYGNYGQGNYGDDLLLRSILNGLTHRVPQQEIGIVTDNYDYLKNWYPLVNFIPSFSDKMHRTKFLIYGGGTQLYSYSNETSRWLNRLLNLPNHLLKPYKTIARISNLLSGRELYQFEHAGAISIGIGPFLGNPSEELHARDAIRKCEFLSVRDSASMTLLKRWNISHGIMYPDLCFDNDLWAETPLVESTSIAPTSGVGIIVRDWKHSKKGMQYLSQLCLAADILRREGLSVRFISFAYNYDKYIRSVMKKKGESLLAWDPTEQTAASFACDLSHFSILISTRAHGIVVGSLLGIPTIAVEIDPKLRFIGEEIREGIVGLRTPFDPVLLTQIVKEILDKRVALSTSALTYAKQCGTKARASLEKLLQWIDSV